MSRNNTCNEQIQPESNRLDIRRNIENDRIRIRNPTLNEYFQDQDIIRQEGYIDAMKLSSNIRILSLNPHGCKPTEITKMNDLKNAIIKYNIDIVLMSEVNTKWNTVNTSKIERWMKEISRGAQIFTADTK